MKQFQVNRMYKLISSEKFEIYEFMFSKLIWMLLLKNTSLTFFGAIVNSQNKIKQIKSKYNNWYFQNLGTRWKSLTYT